MLATCTCRFCVSLAIIKYIGYSERNILMNENKKVKVLGETTLNFPQLATTCRF